MITDLDNKKIDIVDEYEESSEASEFGGKGLDDASQINRQTARIMALQSSGNMEFVLAVDALHDFISNDLEKNAFFRNGLSKLKGKNLSRLKFYRLKWRLIRDCLSSSKHALFDDAMQITR